MFPFVAKQLSTLACVHLVLLVGLSDPTVPISPKWIPNEIAEHHPYLVLHPYDCHSNSDCPPGAVCLHKLCFWSSCLAPSVNATKDRDKKDCSLDGYRLKHDETLSCSTNACPHCTCICQDGTIVPKDCDPDKCLGTGSKGTCQEDGKVFQVGQVFACKSSDGCNTCRGCECLPNGEIRRSKVCTKRACLGHAFCIVRGAEKLYPEQGAVDFYDQCRICTALCDRREGLQIKCSEDMCYVPPEKRDHCFVDGHLVPPATVTRCMSVSKCGTCTCKCGKDRKVEIKCEERDCHVSPIVPEPSNPNRIATTVSPESVEEQTTPEYHEIFTTTTTTTTVPAITTRFFEYCKIQGRKYQLGSEASVFVECNLCKCKCNGKEAVGDCQCPSKKCTKPPGMEAYCWIDGGLLPPGETAPCTSLNTCFDCKCTCSNHATGDFDVHCEQVRQGRDCQFSKGITDPDPNQYCHVETHVGQRQSLQVGQTGSFFSHCNGCQCNCQALGSLDTNFVSDEFHLEDRNKFDDKIVYDFVNVSTLVSRAREIFDEEDSAEFQDDEIKKVLGDHEFGDYDNDDLDDLLSDYGSGDDEVINDDLVIKDEDVIKDDDEIGHDDVIKDDDEIGHEDVIKDEDAIVGDHSSSSPSASRTETRQMEPRADCRCTLKGCPKPGRDQCYINGRLAKIGTVARCATLNCNRCYCACVHDRLQGGAKVRAVCSKRNCPRQEQEVEKPPISGGGVEGSSCHLLHEDIPDGSSGSTFFECRRCLFDCQKGKLHFHCDPSQEHCAKPVGKENFCWIDGQLYPPGTTRDCHSLTKCNKCQCRCDHFGNTQKNCEERKCPVKQEVDTGDQGVCHRPTEVDISSWPRGVVSEVGQNFTCSIRYCQVDCECFCVQDPKSSSGGRVIYHCSKQACPHLFPKESILKECITFDKFFVAANGLGEILSKKENVGNAFLCQKLCQKFGTKCQFWSYADGSQGTVDRHDRQVGKCVLYARSSRLKVQPGVISGNRDCKIDCRLWQGVIVIGGKAPSRHDTEAIPVDTPCRPANGKFTPRVPDFPGNRLVYGGIAETLHGSLVVVCGGFWAHTGKVMPNCYGWDATSGENKWTRLPDMSRPRLGAASVLLTVNRTSVIWVLGGKTARNAKPLGDSEFFDGKTWIKGPDGPGLYEYGHCMVQLDRSRVLLIGGAAHPNDSFIFDLDHQTWKKTSRLNFPRVFSACGHLPSYQSPNQQSAFVVGGEGVDSYVETFDPVSGHWDIDQRWAANKHGEEHPPTNLSGACAVAIKGGVDAARQTKVVLLGGNVGGKRSKDVYLYLHRRGFIKSHDFSLKDGNYQMMCAPVPGPR